MNRRIVTIANNYLSGKGGEVKTFLNKIVCLRGGDNSHLSATFPECETLFVINCEKNYVYYNLDTIRFPNVKKIYTNSHPCEYSVLHRHFLVNGEIEIFLEEKWYHHYKDRWFSEGSYIKPLQNEKMMDELKKYMNEDLIMSNDN